MPITSDRLQEYNQYLNIIKNNGAFLFDNSLVNSSLFATWIPARLQTILKLNNQEIIFNLIPCVFFALMPPFIFLITKKYYNVRLSIITALLPLSFFYFAYYSNLGRVSIVWGFTAGLIWSLISKKYKWSMVFIVFIVTSHYGTSYLIMFSLIGLFLVTCLLSLIKTSYNKESKNNLKFILVITVFSIISTFVWYKTIAPYTGEVVESFIKSSVDLKGEVLNKPKTIINSENEKTIEAESNIIETFDKNVSEYKTYRNFFMIESRESVVQIAFGKTFSTMNIPRKVEFIISWIIVLLITMGLIISIKEKKYNIITLKFMAILYSMILVTIILPHISVYYGVIRVYFTALPILTLCFITSTNKLSDKLKINKYALPLSVITLHYITVSGILHSWFGIVK